MYERFAGVAELADARDLKSRELIPRAGSIPVSGTTTNFISRGRAARLARRAHNPEVRRFKSPPRNQKRKQSDGLLFRFWNDVFRMRNVMRTLCVMTASPCDAPFGRVKEHIASLCALAQYITVRSTTPLARKGKHNSLQMLKNIV